jgi:hypothetical protein
MAKAPTSLRQASRFGKILATLLRRFISWLRCSIRFVVRMRLLWLSEGQAALALLEVIFEVFGNLRGTLLRTPLLGL